MSENDRPPPKRLKHVTLPRLARDERVRSLDDRIGEMMRAAEESGELRAAKSWGKPLDLADGYDETPAELRLGYKILKDAGCAPAEVQLFNEAAALRRQLREFEAASPEAERVRRQLRDVEATLCLRLDGLARSRKA
jgi:hypothetical protein